METTFQIPTEVMFSKGKHVNCQLSNSQDFNSQSNTKPGHNSSDL